MPEFVDYKARRVEIKVGAVFTEYVRGLHGYVLQDILDARDRLRDYVDERDRLQAAYGLTVVSHTFDQDTWEVVVTALYDTDVEEDFPSVTHLLQEYFALETFFYEDDVLTNSCWYTGFNVGDHSGGSE